MSLVDWLGYASVNISAAAAIAIDACILVILNFRHFSKNAVAFQWAGAVGSTHVLFPMIGFMGGWFFIEQYNLAAVVYPLGAILLGILIGFVIRESVKPHSEAKSTLTIGGPISVRILAFWIPIMYVSLDALLAGPGKTVFLDRYSNALAWVSFLIVGVLVALFVLVAGGVSRIIHEWRVGGRLSSSARLAQSITAGVIAEIILFSFFMVWSIAKSIENFPGVNSLEVSLLYIVSVGIVTGGLISFVFYRRIKVAQFVNATSAMTKS